MWLVGFLASSRWGVFVGAEGGFFLWCGGWVFGGGKHDDFFFFSLGEQIWWLSEFMVAWWLFMFGQIWSGFERIGRSNTKLVQNR